LHLFRKAGAEMPFKLPDTQLPAAYRRRLSEAPMLAAAGYLMTLGSADQALQSEWAAGLARLTTRQPFPRDRESFFFRPLELLGICLGLEACSRVDPSHRAWVRDILERGVDFIKDGDLRTQLLASYGSQAVGATWPVPRVPQAKDCGLEELALLVWLYLAVPNLVETLGLGGGGREYEEALLLQTALAPLPQLDVSPAAVNYVALRTLVERYVMSNTERYWQVGKDSRDAVELVKTLCSRFHVYALQLQKRHDQRETLHFEDEYDVQDALHALLRLHFDDVRTEEWTPSYAGNASRIDFLLKREQIIVETKVTRTKRRKLDQKEITNQLIIDKERYRTYPDCKTLVCFIYDPDHLLANAATLESDVSSPGPPLRVVVVTAPTGI
jgi:hypothetical protein